MTAFRLTPLLLFATTLASAASVTVDPTVTPENGFFHYAYSIANSTPDDSFLIDIPVPANPAAVTDLTAPAGFDKAFDSGLGLVSFLEDTSFFGPTPESGFSFDSPDGPGAATFQATLLSNSGSLTTVSGQTLGPVPEPAYSIPLGFVGLAMLATAVLRSRVTQLRARQ